jgi:uncharacterized membrane protein YeaQ/YmgE (transglycosylase-associated protein family)
MPLLETLILLVIAGLVGALAEFLIGFSLGGLLGTMIVGVVGALIGEWLARLLVGVVGALIGEWLARLLKLPAILPIQVGTRTIELVWATLGALVLVGLLSALRMRRSVVS